MAKNTLKLPLVVIFTILAVLTGCEKKNGTQALQQQLVQTQRELKEWKKKYEYAAAELINTKVARRDLDNQLSTAVDSAGNVAKTAEEYLTQLIAENQALNEFIASQEEIIAKQEAALQDLMDMLGISNTDQAQNGY